jgi:hypothetical protein
MDTITNTLPTLQEAQDYDIRAIFSEDSGMQPETYGKLAVMFEGYVTAALAIREQDIIEELAEENLAEFIEVLDGMQEEFEESIPLLEKVLIEGLKQIFAEELEESHRPKSNPIMESYVRALSRTSKNR